MKIKHCPFCSNKATTTSQFIDGRDNCPDTNECYVECSVCNAQGQKFVISNLNFTTASRKDKKDYESEYSAAINDAIKAWNKRK